MGTLGGVASPVSCLLLASCTFCAWGDSESLAQHAVQESSCPGGLLHRPLGLALGSVQVLEDADCEEKKWDLASVDLWNMRVLEPTQILHSWGEECRACAEKADYVNLIKELVPTDSAVHSQTEL